MVQTILGAGGTIARELGKVLPEYTNEIRWVSRNPRPVHPGDNAMAADLTIRTQTMQAVEGSSIAYLVAGLTYDLQIWRVQWPLIMTNVIEACKRNKTRLVFFDNVYCYGKVRGPMTEDTPINPSSQKGEVRAQISRMLLEEVRAGNLEAMIVRAADFHGPGALTFMDMMVYPQLMQGKKATWLCNAQVRHSFTYTPDAAKATALLGNTPTAYNQIWHLPTHRDALTGDQYIRLCAEKFGVTPRYKVYGKTIMRLGGLFNPLVRESLEMLYQYEDEYLFDSGKFERAFQFSPTSYSDGVQQIENFIRAKYNLKK